MTTPASPTEPERCPDCGRPKAKDTRAQTAGCKQGLMGPAGEPYRGKCHELTIARLRAELASVQELSEADRRVVEAAVRAVEVWGESAAMWLPGLTGAVDALLALRKDPTDGT